MTRPPPAESLRLSKLPHYQRTLANVLLYPGQANGFYSRLAGPTASTSTCSHLTTQHWLIRDKAEGRQATYRPSPALLERANEIHKAVSLLPLLKGPLAAPTRHSIVEAESKLRPVAALPKPSPMTGVFVILDPNTGETTSEMLTEPELDAISAVLRAVRR